MKHLYFLFPTTLVGWLVTFLGVAIVIGLLFVKADDRKKGNKSKQPFLSFLFVLGIPLMNWIGEFVLFGQIPFQNVAYDLTILIRLAAVGFPLIYCAEMLSYKKGQFWIAVIGFMYSLLVTHSLFTMVELMSIYAIMDILSGRYQKIPENKNFLKIFLLLIYIAPVIFIFSMAQFPGTLQSRLDYAFTIGWFRWLAYSISFLFARLAFLLLIRHPNGNRNEYNCQDEVHSKKVTSISASIPIGLFLFLILSSLFWIAQRRSVIQKVDEISDEIFQSFAEDYYFFPDTGKALIQSYIGEFEEIENHQYGEKLKEQVNRIPYFYSIVLYEEGVEISAYPDSIASNLQVADTLCSIGTAGEARLRFIQSEGSIIYSYSAMNDQGLCLIGFTSLGFSPQFNQYITLLNHFSTYWQVQDDSTVIYQSGDLTTSNSNQFYISGFVKDVEIRDEPFLLNFLILYSHEEIVEAVADQSYPRLIGIFLFSLLFVVVYQGLFIKRRGFIDHFGHSSSGYESISSESKGQENYHNMALSDFGFQGNIALEKILNTRDIHDINMVLRHNKFLKSLGRMTVIIDPKIPGTNTKEKSLHHTQFLRLAKEAKAEGLQPFKVYDQKKEGSEESSGIYCYPLIINQTPGGFLLISPHQTLDLPSHWENFLSIMSQVIAVCVGQFTHQMALETEISQLRFLIESYPEPILLVKSDVELVLINRAARKLPGIVDEIQSGSIPLRRAIHDVALLKFLLDLEKKDNVVTRYQHTNGHEYLVTILPGDLKLDKMDQWSMITLQDITTFKEQEQVRVELFETVAQYLQMPIKMTRGHLKMLAMVGTLNESQMKYAENMEEAINDIDEFIRQMLERNRLENPMNYHLKATDLDDFLQEVVNRIAPITTQQKVVVTVNKIPADDQRQIQIDPQLFSQALFNIIEYSVYRNKLGGEMSISIEDEDDAYVICISDNGPGISVVDINKIFTDPSVLELHGESPRINMGIQLAKSIIERHHGEIWVTSKLGQGTQFFVKIPR